MDKRAFIERWFTRMWVEKDFSAIDEMLAPDVSAEGLGAHTKMSANDFRAFAEGFLKLVSVDSLTVERTVDEGDWITSLISVTGTGCGSGTPVSFGGQVTARIVDGKIVEAYNSIDFMKMFVELGQLPSDTIQKCFAGQQVA